MTGPLAPAAGAGQGLQAVGSAIGPIDWYFVAMVNFTADIDVPLAGSQMTFHLSTIAPATAAAVEAAQQHSVAWLQLPGPVHAEPGVRDALQHSLFAVLADTGGSFATVAGQLQALLAAIGPAGASPQQVAAATAGFESLTKTVTDAAAAITTAQTLFAGFAASLLSDMTALESGAGSVSSAIDGFGNWYVQAVEHLQSSPLTIGADLKMLQDYATAYRQSLATLQAELSQGIALAGPAASALLQVAEQWATLQQTTQHVAQQVAAASAQSLADALTVLDLAAAAGEWTVIQGMAQSMMTTMEAFPIPRQAGP